VPSSPAGSNPADRNFSAHHIDTFNSSSVPASLPAKWSLAISYKSFFKSASLMDDNAGGTSVLLLV
jgi:hypothetical protein